MTAKITLTWDNGSSEHVDQIVYRSAETFTVDSMPPVLARVGRNAREYVDADIVTGNVYFYAVASEDAVGEILLSSVISVTAESSDGDPHWDNVVSLLHFDDPNDVVKTEKGAAWYIHKTGSGFGEVTQSAAKFGVAGLKLNSPSGANYYFPAKNGTILTKEIFTAEVFCMPRRLPSPIFTTYFGTGSSNQRLIFTTEGKIKFFRDFNALGGYLDSEGANQYALNTYYHVAMSFDGTHIRVFVDGNKEIEVATNSGWSGQSNTLFGLGDTDIQEFNSQYRQSTDIYFDELRITKGVARYTEDFTPPTEPFPNF